MKTLFSFQHDGCEYTVKGDNLGKELLERDGDLVSKRRSFGSNSRHRFLCPNHGSMQLRFRIDVNDLEVQYWLETPERVLVSGRVDCGHIVPDWANNLAKAADNETPPETAPETTDRSPDKESKRKASSAHWATLVLVGLKLLKSGGALKAALAGTALAGWAWLFNLEVAIALVAALLVHEFGHVVAMKRCGLKVKGIFLLPFVGGVAVSDRSQNRWHDFQIAMAGPALGSLGAVVGWALWLHTGSSLVAMFAVVSLLLNIFNLLPIVPLDGGQTLKSIVFSRPGWLGKGLLLGLNALLVVASFFFGFTLLGVFGILGAADLIFTDDSDMRGPIPMNTSGILVATVVYLALIGLLVMLSISMADSGLPGADLPLVFLRS